MEENQYYFCLLFLKKAKKIRYILQCTYLAKLFFVFFFFCGRGVFSRMLALRRFVFLTYFIQKLVLTISFKSNVWLFCNNVLGMSTFVGYLMPKPLSQKNNSGTI